MKGLSDSSSIRGLTAKKREITREIINSIEQRSTPSGRAYLRKMARQLPDCNPVRILTERKIRESAMKADYWRALNATAKISVKYRQQIQHFIDTKLDPMEKERWQYILDAHD